jgi:cytochrome c2
LGYWVSNAGEAQGKAPFKAFRRQRLAVALIVYKIQHCGKHNAQGREGMEPHHCSFVAQNSGQWAEFEFSRAIIRIERSSGAVARTISMQNP